MTEQDAVASAMQASCQAGHTGPGRQGQTQCSKWTRYDEAVAALTLAATAGQFAQPGSPAAGRCYGRLCNIVRVRQSGMTRAANAAVAELVNLGTCVFVSDRQMANTVGADEGPGWWQCACFLPHPASYVISLLCSLCNATPRRFLRSVDGCSMVGDKLVHPAECIKQSKSKAGGCLPWQHGLSSVWGLSSDGLRCRALKKYVLDAIPVPGREDVCLSRKSMQANGYAYASQH